MENKVAEAIIRALDEYASIYSWEYGLPPYEKTMPEMITIVNKEISATQNEWVDVRDRLPNSDTACLVSDCKRIDGIAYYHRDIEKWYSMGETIIGVTHWMPLPNPPSIKPLND